MRNWTSSGLLSKRSLRKGEKKSAPYATILIKIIKMGRFTYLIALICITNAVWSLLKDLIWGIN
jgi:hypothetical protein